jgi:hypothetical protein
MERERENEMCNSDGIFTDGHMRLAQDCLEFSLLKYSNIGLFVVLYKGM